MTTKSGGFCYDEKSMKNYCGECEHLKYEDADGFGWCGLWEESDVNSKDEACCEFNEKEDLYGELGSIESS